MNTPSGIDGNVKWFVSYWNNHNVTAKDILRFVGQMMDEYGLRGIKIHPYGK